MTGNDKVGVMAAVFQPAKRDLRKFGWIALALFTVTPARAAEHIVLNNGFDLICDHRAPVSSASGSRIRLYMDAGSTNFIEVDPSQIVASDFIAPPVPMPPQPATPQAATPEAELTQSELHQLLATAGAAHNLNTELLASVVREESGGRTHAISRAGAQGLMQLMPGTAAELGVSNAFAPGENVRGGAAYLDTLLHRYHDNLALALAAYNAGPAAVDRWHGIPPYLETQLYVARVIHEFNRRAAAAAKAHPLAQVASAVR
ncbi:MAG TPA: lytic transglycosylase domain-containing protein [Silvibacterium sp.]|nr:lytic transglycosylase domain-containing protein [Silvibacterium sp.]